MAISFEKRWEAVLAWKDLKSIKKAARRVRMSPKVTRHWVNRYIATGGVDELPKAGRPSLMSAEARAAAYDMLKDGKCQAASEVAVELKRQGVTKTKVSKSTVLRAAKAEGVERGQPLVALRGQPAKKLSNDTKCKRLAFALANRRTPWSQVMFTDRKKFLFSYPGQKVSRVQWVVKGTQRQAAAVNHPQCLNVYAGITKWGVTKIHVVAGSSKHKTTYRNKKGQLAKNITSDEYLRVVSDTLLPEGTAMFSKHGMGSWTLQQDNDPTHRVAAAAAMKSWNEKKGSSISLLPNWPPNSPDLNLIENLWGYVGAKVQARGPTSFEAFKHAVVEELGSVPERVLKNLYKSMPRRIAQVIELGGDKTKY
jgi:transposase